MQIQENTHSKPDLTNMRSGPIGTIKPIYLDNHATTRVDQQVVSAMLPYLYEEYGNASSQLHYYGRQAAKAIDFARENVASLVGSEPEDIIFTSGATESDNLAIKGICLARPEPEHLITSCTEHHAVLDVCKDLERAGWSVTYLPSTSDGRLTVDNVLSAIRPNTRVITIMWANNETGVINDVCGIAEVCRNRGIFFHTDCAQAVGRIPIDLSQTNIDLLSLSAHKFYGPKGIGALVVRRSARRAIRPLLQGGGQERGIRPGTVAVHQVVGLGEAARLAAKDLKDGEMGRIAGLRDKFLAMLSSNVSLQVNGSMAERLPGNLNVWFHGCDSQALAMRCHQVAFSTGSACTTNSMQSSYVISALTGDEQRAAESARFGFGRFSSEEEIENAVEALANAVLELRSLALHNRSSPIPSASSSFIARNMDSNSKPFN
jgi:cysteine desulfurase